MSFAGGTLEQRVSALEQKVALQGGSEPLSPNYLTVTPAGLVSANFTGIVNALGLVLPASAVASPPPDSQIQWQRTSDGSLVASVSATDIVNNQNIMSLINHGRSGSTLVESTMQAIMDSNGQAATIQVGANTNAYGGPLAAVSAIALYSLSNGYQRVILNSAGGSGYPQIHGDVAGQGLFIDANIPNADDPGGACSLYAVSWNSQGSGTTQTATFLTNRTPWTRAVPLGALYGNVHGGTTAIALPWGWEFTAPATFGITVTNATGFTVDWTWTGLVIGQ